MKKIINWLIIIVALLTLVFAFTVNVMASDEDGVCKIGTTTYASIDEAISAIYDETNTGDIVLLSNVSKPIEINEGYDVSIDLNGFVLKKGVFDNAIITNNGTLTIKDSSPSAIHYFTYVTNAAWEYYDDTKPDESVSIANTYNDITDNTDYVVVHGGCITDGTGCEGLGVTISESQKFGGGIANFGTLNIAGGNIVGNTSHFGGGIYNNHGCTTVAINCSIVGNASLVSGGGIMVSNIEYEECFPEGTRITMADGSYKNIEDLHMGDYVRTFDHEVGQLSSGRIFSYYVSEDKHSSFTLHFTNDINLSIAGAHSLLERDSLKYVVVSEYNAQSYIGKYFYNADCACWEQLKSVTYNSTPVKYYAVYTAKDINCIAEGMLSVVDDTAYMLNVFDLDDDLKFDPIKKQADIEKYGLMTFEECSFVTRQEYEDANVKYIKVIIGKGLATKEQMMKDRSTGREYELPQINKTVVANKMSSLPKVGGLPSAPVAPLTIGSNVTILFNTENGKESNVYLSDGKLIEIQDAPNGTNVGISMEVPGQFSIEGTSDYASKFSSDEPIYMVFFNINSNTLELRKNCAWYYTTPSATSFEISNIDELEGLSYIVNHGLDTFEGKTILLSSFFENEDCDGLPTALNTPIGQDLSHYFSGTFNGNGKEVALNTESNGYGGLFGVISGAAIKNVGVRGSVSAQQGADGKSVVGGIAGLSENSSIVNCYSFVDVVSYSFCNYSCAGGITGYLINSNIENCYCTGMAQAFGDLTNNITAGGIVGNNEGTIKNCYYLVHNDADDNKDINVDRILIGKGSGLVLSCCALDIPQMQAGVWERAGAEDNWLEISVEEYESTKMSLVEALNRYVYFQSDEYCVEDNICWAVLQGSDGYPIFALSQSIYLIDGLAYNDVNEDKEQIAMPKGISFIPKTANTVGTYVFDNINIPSVSLDNHNYYSLIIADSSPVAIKLVGNNYIGGKANIAFYDEEERNSGSLWYACTGIELWCDVAFTGNGTLTIYDAEDGIGVKESEVIANVVFDNDFSGTINIYDRGQGSDSCCISTVGGHGDDKKGSITINNGRFNLYSIKTQGIYSSNVFIDGGIINISAGSVGIGADEVIITSGAINVIGTEEGIFGEQSVFISGGNITAVSMFENEDESGYGIKGAEITILDGIIKTKAISGYAISGDTVLCVSDKLSITGAMESYVSGATFALTNANANYVVIQQKQTPKPTPEISAYSVIVSGTNGGTISSSLDNAQSGRTVTLTVKADEGYKFESIVATDKLGNDVRLIVVKDGGKYSFTMPSSFVSVVANFKKIEDEKPEERITNPFVDVFEDGYYYDAVLWAAQKGITSGMDATHFAPFNITTRAQMVTFLWRAAGCPEPKSSTCVFVDVEKDSYYEKAVIWGYENTYVKGISATEFAPNQNVTRGQTVAFLARTNGVLDEATGYTHDFIDVNKQDYYNNAVAWAQTEGITSGMGDNLFAPLDNCLRGQIVTFLYRNYVR